MAVVSISRIQIRRGRKNTGSGFPQLASGELGWAIDSQELYIGNGSVSEGSPYVGNTKLLSEHDNLFEFASNYSYRDGSNIQTGDSINLPIQRSLQDRLDDIVSVRSFGATGSAGTDQTAALQRAIFQLFSNTDKDNPNSRKVLILEPGTYDISSTIYLPPFTTIQGAGIDKTVINMSGTGAVFQTVNGLTTTSTVGSVELTTSDNQARKIKLTGFSISTTSADSAIVLNHCRDSVFENISLQGQFANGDSEWADIGISMTISNTLAGAATKNNFFNNLIIKNYGYGVRSKYDIVDNIWYNCRFENLGYGIEFGESTDRVTAGEITGPRNNVFDNCVFDNIDRHGIWISNGKYNLSSQNKFYTVGNDTGTEQNATYSVINFSDSSNLTLDDFFARTENLSYGQAFITNSNPYVPEVAGSGIFDSKFTNELSIGELQEPEIAFRFPADSPKTYTIDYMYVSDQHNVTRQGQLGIVSNPKNGTIHLTDDYDITGDTVWNETLEFSAILSDRNMDGTLSDNGLDTIEVYVLNLAPADNAKLYWNFNTKTHIKNEF